MKKNIKLIAFLLVILSVILAFSACDKKKDGEKTPKEESKYSGKLLKPYMDITKSKKYILKTEVNSGGKNAEVTVTVSGDDKRLLTLPMELEDGTTPFSFLFNGENRYILMPTVKAYSQVDKNLFDKIAIEQGTNLNTYTGFYQTLHNFAFVGEGKSDDGMLYEDYYNPATQATIRFFFEESSKALKKRGVVVNGQVTDVRPYVILGDVNDAMFQIPEGYKQRSEIGQTFQKIYTAPQTTAPTTTQPAK
ncbi:MAG: hypothetical protein Q4E28_04150 [Clostridia bacterium]|nr:hypothetical protein [Clostridia bacterium]